MGRDNPTKPTTRPPNMPATLGEIGTAIPSMGKPGFSFDPDKKYGLSIVNTTAVTVRVSVESPGKMFRMQRGRWLSRTLRAGERVLIYTMGPCELNIDAVAIENEWKSDEKVLGAVQVQHTGTRADVLRPGPQPTKDQPKRLTQPLGDELHEDHDDGDDVDAEPEPPAKIRSLADMMEDFQKEETPA